MLLTKAIEELKKHLLTKQKSQETIRGYKNTGAQSGRCEFSGAIRDG
jgi:ribosomal protein S15P/S13E